MKRRRSSIFGENDIFDPCDPYVTFDPKLVMSRVTVHRLVIVTKFGQNRPNHVGDIDMLTERRRKKETRQKQDPDAVSVRVKSF